MKQILRIERFTVSKVNHTNWGIRDRAITPGSQLICSTTEKRHAEMIADALDQTQPYVDQSEVTHNEFVCPMKNVPSVDLLAELIRRAGGTHAGPIKSEYAPTIREVTVGIGNHNTANIRLHEEDLDALGVKCSRHIKIPKYG